MATWTTRRFDEIAVGDSASYSRTLAALADLAAAESAGVVLGARVPIVLTRRADSARNREASAAVMALLAHSRCDKLGGR